MLSNKLKKSFTLVEIIIVVTIIGVLATAGVDTYSNFRYRLTFESNFQQILKFFNNARQFAMTGIKVEDSSGQTVSPKYFEISSNDSDELKLEAYIEESDDTILLDTLTLSDRYWLNFERIDPNSFPIYIIYTVGADGVKILSSDSYVVQNEIKIVLSDKKINTRTKSIYINSLSGVVEEL